MYWRPTNGHILRNDRQPELQWPTTHTHYSSAKVNVAFDICQTNYKGPPASTQWFNSPSASSPVKKSSSQDSQYYYYYYYTFYPFTGTHDAYRTRGTREKDVATYFIQWYFAKSSGVAEENTEERWKTLLKVGAQRMSCSLMSLLSLRVHCEDERLVKVVIISSSVECCRPTTMKGSCLLVANEKEHSESSWDLWHGTMLPIG